MIRDEQAVIAHYHSQGAHLSIGAGSPERIPTLEDTARKAAQLWADEMNNVKDEDRPPAVTAETRRRLS